MSIKITGLLKENNSNNTLSGLHVEAYNDAHTVWLGGAKSDTNGRFTFYLREDVDVSGFPINIVVYRNRVPYYTTKLTEFEEQYEIILSSLNERVPNPTHELLEGDQDFFVVHGTLKDAAGKPMRGERILISASGFRSKYPITYAETNHKGYYSVKIARASLNVEETLGERSLLVEAVTLVEAEETVFATSGELFDIPLKLEVNLQTTDTNLNTIEYTRVYNAILGKLPSGDTITSISIEGDERDSVYLAKLIAESESLVITLVTAFVYAGELGIQPELVYGLLRAGASNDKVVVFNQAEAALRSAIAASEGNKTINILPDDEVNYDIEIILQWQINQVVQIEIPTEETTLEDIFNTVFPGETQTTYLTDLLTATRNFSGASIEEFWTDFETEHGPDQTEQTQKALQLLAVTGLQPNMTKYLLDPDNFNSGELEFNGDIQDLLRWDEAKWATAITAAGGVDALPKSVSPEGNADDIPVYAAKLREVVEALYPTAAIKSRIATDASLLDSSDMQDAVTTFLDNNPNYDFKHHSVYDINDSDFNLTGISANLDDLKIQLAPFQRLARLTGGAPGAIALLKTADVTSAHAIVNSYTPTQFANSFGNQMGQAAAQNTYAAAARVSTLANEAAVEVARISHHSFYVERPNQPIDPSASPELSTLFGSLEQCGCEYCMSLYSPSAYYVDILNFIKKSSNSSISRAFTELDRRRPDLKYIDLTCKNANTPLPYIDLVNELLELEILRKNPQLPGYPASLPLSYQTDAEATELSAYPEHKAKLLLSSSPAVYGYEESIDYRKVYDEVLNSELYPDILPFNLAWEEARVYLKHLGKSRYELMQLLKPITANTTDAHKITYRNLLGEYLGISKEAADHITEASLSPSDISPYYGFTSATSNDLLSPSDTSVMLNGTWDALLTGNVTDGGIDVLLSRLDISYKELLQLLTTESLNKADTNGDRPVNIKAKSTDPKEQATCVLKELKLDIQNPPHSVEDFFSALHRFVRLWRATGLTIYELDRVLTSLNISSFNNSFLTDGEYLLVAQAIVFARRFKVSIDEITTWWADISMVNYVNYNTEYQDALPSFFDKLFKSKLVKNPVDTTFDGILAGGYTKTYSDHIPVILSATGISEEELKLLADASILDINMGTPMTVPKLTEIFREAMAARMLGISVKDLTRIYRIKGIDPTPATPRTFKQRQELLEELNDFVITVKSSRFSLAEWEYLIKNDDTVAQLAPTEKDMLSFYEKLQTELYKVGAVLDSFDSIASLSATLTSLYAAIDLLDPPSDPGDAMEIEILEKQVEEILQQLEHIDNIRNQQKSILIHAYASEFDVNADIIHYLLTDEFTINYNPGIKVPVLDAFITDSFYKADLTTSSSFLSSYTYESPSNTFNTVTVSFNLENASDENMFDIYQRLSKISLIANRLKLKKEEFEVLQDKRVSLDGIDALALEGNISPATPNTLDQFAGYINWIKVRDLLGASGVSFKTMITDVLNASEKSEWIDTIMGVAKWDYDTLEELVGLEAQTTPVMTSALPGELNPQFPADFKKASLILRIADIINAGAVIGISPKEFKRKDGGTERSILWSNLKMIDSEKIIKTARAKYNTDAAWSKVAKPLRDVLREKQRKALVAYLLAHPNPTIISSNPEENQRWRNENELYAYFLIDVEMSPCMKTSRTRQAINSIQLFMDRAMMNLEYENMMPWETGALIEVAKEDVDEWKTWRKWYRIWEANRKIFLYPENWIEPELRDGKSPEFVEFETHLMQDDVTPRLVEEAFVDYLEKLDDFARLEPVTNYHELEPATETSPGVDIIHAFARTHVQPHTYYYRRFEANEWTPWEKINLDIKGDHFTAYVVNKRLYIFWLTFIEKQKANNAEGKSTSRIIGDQDGMASDDINDWRANTWLGSVFEFCQPSIIDTGMLSKSDELNKQWDVYLNWSEYKDQKWQAAKVSKEKMELIPHLITISPLAQSSVIAKKNIMPYSGSPKRAYDYILDYLTENAEVTPSELFRNRIYLFPGEWVGNLYLSLQLTDGMDEYCVGIHAFKFTEDMTNVSVLRTDELEFCTKAPDDTLINNNRFIESPVGESKKLWVNKLTHTGDAHFGYTYKSMHYSNRFRNIEPASILDSTPYGLYKIAAKANLPDIGYWGAECPTHNHFFFEDDVNTYFVKRIPGPAIFASVAQVQEQPKYLLNAGELSLPRSLGFALVAYRKAKVHEAEAPTKLLPGFPRPEKLDPMEERPQSWPPVGSTTEGITGLTEAQLYKFETFYHPHANSFIKKLNTEGVKGLLNLRTQVNITGDTMDFENQYDPTSLVYKPYPTNIVDFDYGGSYSLYNWELFFHMPLTIAQRLSNNQQFEEAQKWYHYIFDPTCNVDDGGVQVIPGKQRFWRFRPFYDYTVLQQSMSATQFLASITNNADQIDAWEKNPFKPHVIARLRISAYMKNVVMKYIDNLIAWGDQLFRRDTIESINEATQLYILAANILGERPQEIPARAKSDKYSFTELDDRGIGLFSNAQVEIEQFLGPNISSAATVSTGHGTGTGPVTLGSMGYFCLSNNDKLLGYWDTVADRLFKIRNCRNIDGVLRELPLYEPPIDPALLVKAAAAGVDINSVLDAQAGIGMPHYRFQYVLQKANELCADVRGLGGAVLSALEKKDAEALALLRSGHEITVMEKVRSVKEAQVKEAEEGLNGLLKTKEATEIRSRYYSSRQFMNSGESQHFQSLQTGMTLQAIQGGLQTTTSALSLIPQFHGQATFAVGASFGGHQLFTALDAISNAIGIAATINSAKGNMAQVKAGYERRMDDWKFQAETAAKELEQIDKQIIGAEIRLDIAKRELQNHELQMENTKEADEYMRSKFTNVELYNWMLGQLATVYFQSYQLAYDLAKKAESCYDFELPHAKEQKPVTGFIKFGYWDSLKKGLLAGEKLQFDLRKMDASYMEQNKRTLELTKHISLAMVDPEAVLALRNQGKCIFDTKEWMFDLDFPNHFYRRIKSVSLSIPAVTGPYTTMGATLSMGSSTIYDSNYDAVSSPRPAMSSIATSTGQNDAGVFELNFRDERHLPFEGAGVEAGWSLDMMEQEAFRQFDYSTISDVIVHIKYTAYNDETGGKKELALDTLSSYLENTDSNKELPRYFSLKHEFSNDWYAYAKESNGDNAPANYLEVQLKQNYYPFFCKGKMLESNKFFIVLSPKQPFDSNDAVVVELDDLTSVDAPINLDPEEDMVNSGNINLISDISLHNAILKWKIKVNGTAVNIDETFDDIYLVTYYKLSTS